jgi:hypothetical protein
MNNLVAAPCNSQKKKRRQSRYFHLPSAISNNLENPLSHSPQSHQKTHALLPSQSPISHRAIQLYTSLLLGLPCPSSNAYL